MNLHAGKLLFALLLLSAAPQMAQADDDLQSKETWLRYSNWEHRSLYKAPLQDKKNESENKEKNKSKLELPENPGYHTVENNQFSIPGYAFQNPQTQSSNRPAEILTAGSYGYPGFGSRPFGSYPNAFMGAYQSPIFVYSGLSTFRPGFTGLSLPGLGFASNSFGSGFRAYGMAANLLSMPFYRGGMLPAQSRLGPPVIQTGPSPSSGNYYQPATAISPSSNFYASSAPWQVPVQEKSEPKDYWGPSGNPFKP
ncbi:MAG: hypothetical protein K2X27_19730 [Candidatus Obscuribacterales bacterium]|nr:hypothetical protein [Candidatus Obscuribacterales bacterium]